MTGLEDVEYALTIKPPWAVLVVEGPKTIENRSWAPPDRIIGKRIAIHAGKGVDRSSAAGEIFFDGVRRGMWPNNRKEWRHIEARGAIIGTAVVTRYRENRGGLSPSHAQWFFGPIGWELEDRRPLEQAVPCKGALGLWRIDRALAAAKGTP